MSVPQRSVGSRAAIGERATRDLERLRMRVLQRRYTPEERTRLLALIDAAAREAREAVNGHAPLAAEQPLLIAPDPREGRNANTRRRRAR
jgi:hypothetical protein